MTEPTREILRPKRGSNGLFIQPKDSSAQRELVEMHNRQRFANHFKYADQFCGNTRTYDPDGRYNCGRCNMADGTTCLLVKIPKIDKEAGSCGDWEDIAAGDPEMELREKSIDSAGYGVAANGKGFGCHRCPFASAAFQPDSQGRDLYCGKGDMRVFSDACCVLNGAPLKGDDDEDEMQEYVDEVRKRRKRA